MTINKIRFFLSSIFSPCRTIIYPSVHLFINSLIQMSVCSKCGVSASSPHRFSLFYFRIFNKPILSSCLFLLLLVLSFLLLIYKSKKTSYKTKRHYFLKAVKLSLRFHFIWLEWNFDNIQRRKVRNNSTSSTFTIYILNYFLMDFISFFFLCFPQSLFIFCSFSHSF